jgi:hypothetical protein
MEMNIEEFFHDFRQALALDAETNANFQLSAFMEAVANEIMETGFIEGFEICHHRAPRGGMRVDGFWFNDDGALDLFVADFDARTGLESLSQTEVAAAFRRIQNFLEDSLTRNLADKLEETSPGWGLARQIADRREKLLRINFFLFSERSLSDRLRELEDGVIAGIPASFHVWDISRLHRQRTSRGHREPLDLDLETMFGTGLPCLPAYLDTENYQSYLAVMPAEMLAALYGQFGARLLEQNVRTFLQARGSVNKGIRETILAEPEMFFAYNNGITATARAIDTQSEGNSLTITRLVDLQIVNGGQTTASLFHAKKRDRAELSKIFVQMKLSIIDSAQSEQVVPKISQYANTQNKVNAADFFSNHPFHVRLEEFSRRIWAPARHGAQRETKWFYERTRGQYVDAQSRLSPSEQKRFRAENPKSQMFTKTDLAKFENVWDDHPKWVNLGAQKNFSRYAEHIGKEWEKGADAFNEYHFKRTVARAILFRTTERIVSGQSWYSGGYRANIVAYTLALLAETSRRQNRHVDFLGIWDAQEIDTATQQALAMLARAVNEEIGNPERGIINISEWCKKEACWSRMEERLDEFASRLPDAFRTRLLSADQQRSEEKMAKKIQKLDNGIDAQRRILQVPVEKWALLHRMLHGKGMLSPNEVGILKIAMQIPIKIPTERQCAILLELADRGRAEGVVVHQEQIEFS